jgi:hypothetical protein
MIKFLKNNSSNKEKIVILMSYKKIIIKIK